MNRWYAKVRNKIQHFLFKTGEADILSMQQSKHGGWNQEGLGVYEAGDILNCVLWSYQDLVNHGITCKECIQES